LQKTKPVIFCGDLNVAHQEIDLTHPKANRLNAGFTDEERRGFSEHLAAGFVDTFREFCKEGGHYTWWSLATQARERNVGWRIDYFCISTALRSVLSSAFILPQIMGSDHCPVGVTLEM
jgi:exodeoxyribonuclease-3